LLYGKEDKISIHLDLNAMTYIANIEDLEEVSPFQRRYDQLMQLEEQINEALRKMTQIKQFIKKHFYQGTSAKYFQKGQLVLLWNKFKETSSLHTKFEAFWIGPYIVENNLGYN
jgi:hypothetical protein